MRPARNDCLPARTPPAIASAISAGCCASATAVLTRQASAPCSIASAASDGAPMPASTTTGTVACSMMMRIASRLTMPCPEPMGEPSGITAERVAEVVAAGARGVAVIGAIAAADDPRIAAIRLRDALAATLTQDKEQDMPEQFATIVAITVNGKPTEVPEGATIHDFLASRRMTDAMAIVERNGEIVPRAAYGETALAAGDVLEVVHAVGGG